MDILGNGDVLYREVLTVAGTAVGFAQIPGEIRTGAITFTGSGNNDLTLVGSSYSGDIERSMQIKIDAGDATNPNTFKVSDDGGTLWQRTGVAITGSSQTILRGITGTFAATTGHTTNDLFAFTAYPPGRHPGKVIFVIEGGAIRFHENGDTPTSSVGTYGDVGEEIEIIGIHNIYNFKAIRVNDTATLSIKYHI